MNEINNMSLANTSDDQTPITSGNDVIDTIFSRTEKFYLDIFVFLVIGYIVATLGITTNILNLIVFYKDGLKDGMNIGFFALSFSDLAVAILWFFAISCYVLHVVNPTNRIDATSLAYIFTGSPRGMFVGISSFTTIFLSVERCICVVRPFKVKAIFTPSRRVWILTFIYVLNIAMYIPLYLSAGLAWQFDSRLNKTRLLTKFNTQFRDEAEIMSDIINGTLVPALSHVVVIVTAVVLISAFRSSVKFRRRVTKASSKNFNFDNTGGQACISNLKQGSNTDSQLQLHVTKSCPCRLPTYPRKKILNNRGGNGFVNPGYTNTDVVNCAKVEHGGNNLGGSCAHVLPQNNPSVFGIKNSLNGNRSPRKIDPKNKIVTSESQGCSEAHDAIDFLPQTSTDDVYTICDPKTNSRSVNCYDQGGHELRVSDALKNTGSITNDKDREETAEIVTDADDIALEFVSVNVINGVSKHDSKTHDSEIKNNEQAVVKRAAFSRETWTDGCTKRGWANGTTKGGSQNKSDKCIMTRKDARLVKMVAILVVIHVTCMTPGLVFAFARLFIQDLDIGKRFHYLHTLLYSVICTSEGIGGGVNMFVYYKISSKYRAIFRQTFCNHCK